MTVLIYLIIALTLLLVVFGVNNEHITNRNKEWVDSKYFWIAISMIIFPLTLPAIILSKIILKIYKPNKSKQNENN